MEFLSSDESDEKCFYQFIDPFSPSDVVDVCSVIGNSDNIFITESNKKFSIIEDKLHITDLSNEDTFQQVFKKTTYHSNIYTLPIFKAVQNMLKGIVNNEVC